MKHTVRITITIIVLFLIAQFIGLAVIKSYDQNFGRTAMEAREEALEKGLPLPPEPEVSVVRETIPPEVELRTVIDVTKIITSIVVAILIATALFFLLSRVRVTVLLKVWFSVVVFICLTLALSLFLYPILPITLFSIGDKQLVLAEMIALPLAICLTFFKIVKRNILVHNFTELFIYPGLAVIFLPLFGYSENFGVLTAAILLIAISIYDMIAVWKTKYMIRLAKFQIKHLKIFTGFFMPYVRPKDRIKIQKMRVLAKREEKRKRAKKKGKIKKAKAKKKAKKRKRLRIKVEIGALGGGDVAFPLIFAGTILLAFGLLASIITILCTTLALGLLLWFSEKGKFYPAMPFLSAGCFLGLALVLIFL